MAKLAKDPKVKFVGVHIPTETNDDLERIAAANDQSKAAVIRRAIFDLLEKLTKVP